MAFRVRLKPTIAGLLLPGVAAAQSLAIGSISATSSTADESNPTDLGATIPSIQATSNTNATAPVSPMNELDSQSSEIPDKAAAGPPPQRTRLAPANAVTSQQPTTKAPSRGPHLLPVALEVLGLFTLMRGAEAYLWPDPFSFKQIDQWPHRYKHAFTMPPVFDSSKPFMRWDGDRWQINGIGHGLLGSELYLRPRRCGFSWYGSLGLAAASSTLWEYLVEGNGVRPSGLDLIYTPLSGLVFGEARYQAFRVTDGIHDPTLRAVLRSVIDPIGEFTTSAVGSPC